MAGARAKRTAEAGHVRLQQTGDFHITHIEEYAGGLLIALQKPISVGGGIRPILCGDAWHRCFAILAANATQGSVANIFNLYL